ncbi:hypothetical protein PoB_003734500 [Plakobranchus ocellatus]|uniref:Uncharacterized protein n=1 Tax=Plakobranchus ocellatus TaxID=259542 RepID=A0AAV4ARD9_9GAST|nr:hypothetical protein PoB_003734500 [Plakobranchus ocellatus]
MVQTHTRRVPVDLRAVLLGDSVGRYPYSTQLGQERCKKVSRTLQLRYLIPRDPVSRKIVKKYSFRKSSYEGPYLKLVFGYQRFQAKAGKVDWSVRNVTANLAHSAKPIYLHTRKKNHVNQFLTIV